MCPAGYTCDHYQHRARLIDTLAAHSIVHVLALKQAVFVLDAEGAVWSWGQGASGKMGHETRDTLIEPARIRALAGNPIVHIAGTDDFVCAVNQRGQAFAWGYCAFLPNDATTTTAATSGGGVGAGGNNSKLQAGSGSPQLRPTEASSAAPGASGPARPYSQLPRRLECLKGVSVARLYPSSNRLVVLSHDSSGGNDLLFLGQSLEDSERWEALPKKFAAASALPPGEAVIHVHNADHFVAVLSDAGVIRIQRRNERKLNKIWLQNYKDTAGAGSGSSAGSSAAAAAAASKETSSGARTKTIRDLFPLIPHAHVVRMSWSADGRRGAAVTQAGQLFTFKLSSPERERERERERDARVPGASPVFGPSPAAGGASSGAAMPSLSLGGGLGGGGGAGEKAAPSSRGGPAFPRTVGYLVEGLAHVRVTDCTVASGHTTVLTEEGHVYSFGPTAPGHVHAQQSAAAAALQPVQRPRRLVHLAQVSRVFSNEQYVVVAVAVTRPSPLPSFPELRGVFDTECRPRPGAAAAVEVPPLRLLCEFHLSQQITPLTVVAAYQWSFNTASPNLLRYCTSYLLRNLALYLPQLLALGDIACLQYLQGEYARAFPMWWHQPQRTQPFLVQGTEGAADQPFFAAVAPMGEEGATDAAAHAGAAAASTGGDVDSSESFSFTHALVQLKIASQRASQPRTTEERVGDIRLRRRALRKKLQQIEGLEALLSRRARLDREQQEKVLLKQTHLQEVEALEYATHTHAHACAR